LFVDKNHSYQPTGSNQQQQRASPAAMATSAQYTKKYFYILVDSVPD
jgi:hypothetical protein